MIKKIVYSVAKFMHNLEENFKNAKVLYKEEGDWCFEIGYKDGLVFRVFKVDKS